MKKSGFTLVEAIVAMTVLSLLATISIIPLVSYVDKANQQRALIEARTILLASQVTVSPVYLQDQTDKTDQKKEITDLAEVDGKIIDLVINDNKISYLHYSSSDNIEVIYDIDWKKNQREGIYSIN